MIDRDVASAPGGPTSSRTRTCDVCIVTYNSAGTISRLIRSLHAEPTVATIRLLDNASSDATLAVARAAGDAGPIPLVVDASATNLGFPAGVNRLLKNATSEVVAIVNPDIEFTRGTLSRLVDAVVTDRSIGIASCRLTTRDGRPQSEPARARPRQRRLLAG
jgi:N-acetylglucosaminyl-diphospho-decaprenol L-rhamnosyltransferase